MHFIKFPRNNVAYDVEMTCYCHCDVTTTSFVSWVPAGFLRLYIPGIFVGQLMCCDSETEVLAAVSLYPEQSERETGRKYSPIVAERKLTPSQKDFL